MEKSELKKKLTLIKTEQPKALYQRKEEFTGLSLKIEGHFVELEQIHTELQSLVALFSKKE
jgi:hypothetical protein